VTVVVEMRQLCMLVCLGFCEKGEAHAMQLGRMTCVRTSLRQWRNGGRTQRKGTVCQSTLALPGRHRSRQEGLQWAAPTFCDV
jgi:hypothetical protein